MKALEACTLELHEVVVWTPDGTNGEVFAKDNSGVKIRWKDGQFGYYQFTDLLSQIERFQQAEPLEPELRTRESGVRIGADPTDPERK